MHESPEHELLSSGSRQFPPGCSLSQTRNGEAVIWVEFPPESPLNPFFFTPTRKRIILSLALFYSFVASVDMGTWSTSQQSMSRDLNLSTVQVSAGVAMFCWGFAITPLFLAPISEEMGRRWTYIIAVFLYWQCHLFACLGKNLETLLVGRFLQGASASVGAALVAGTISDIYQPDDRGHPMTLFGVSCWLGSGLGPLIFCWVEANPKLEWRWIQWIQYIVLAAYVPLVAIFMKETRASQILKDVAIDLQRKHAQEYTQRFVPRIEVEDVAYAQRVKTSLLRPMKFLIFEPIVTFFSIWISLGWGVLFVMFTGLPFIFGNVYGFGITGSGLVYSTLVIAAFLGYAVDFLSEALYSRNKATRGPEARLYTPMASGIAFAVGCFIFGFTGRAEVHWVVPCIGIVVLMTAVLNIYIVSFTYLAECYGSQASSAIAAQSFLRNNFAAAFSLFTQPMFVTMTAQWAIFTFGCLAAVLAVVPFIAFWKGPQIRARSAFSKELMRQEAQRVALESGHAPGFSGSEGGASDLNKTIFGSATPPISTYQTSELKSSAHII